MGILSDLIKSKSVQAEPKQEQPTQPANVPAQPVETKPAQTATVEKPVQAPTPVQTVPVQPMQAQPVKQNPNLTPTWQQKEQPAQPSPIQPKPNNIIPVWQQKEKTQKPFSAVPEQEPVESVQPTISDRVKQGDSLYDILKEMGRPVDWEAEKKKAKRERSAAIIGDLAGLIGNTVGLAAGARQFNFQPKHTEKANENLERLLGQERADNVDYFNKTLNARMNDYKLNRAQEIEQAKINYRAYQDGLKNNQWGSDFKIKVANLDRALNNDKITQDQWAKQFNETVKQHGISNKIAGQNAATSARNANTSEARLNYEKGKESKSAKDYIVLGNDKVQFDKAMTPGIMSNIYGKMQDIATKEGRKDLESVNLQFGEGGDQASKVATIVRKNIDKYPALHSYVKELINKENYSQSKDLSNILK